MSKSEAQIRFEDALREQHDEARRPGRMLSANATAVWFFGLLVALIVGCTASVAYWAHSAAGLWSLIALMVVRIKLGKIE